MIWVSKHCSLDKISAHRSSPSGSPASRVRVMNMSRLWPCLDSYPAEIEDILQLNQQWIRWVNQSVIGRCFCQLSLMEVTCDLQRIHYTTHDWETIEAVHSYLMRIRNNQLGIATILELVRVEATNYFEQNAIAITPTWKTVDGLSNNNTASGFGSPVKKSSVT